MKPGYGRIDKVLLLSVMAIAFVGITLLYSATYVKGAGLSFLVVKQCIWVLVGFFLMIIIANTDYVRILDFAYFAYLINIGLLIFLLVFGGERFGAKRWIDLGFFSLQPSEFAKIIIIFVLAAFLGERKDKVGSFDNFIYACGLVAPLFILILLQPDLGTSLVLIPILFSILLICGEKRRYLVTSVVLGVLAMPIFWNLLKDYQKSRLMVFINPNIDPLGAGYTIIQSRIAIGSGGLFGKGFLNGTQNQLKFLPEKQTDFIFSILGEEFGFVGALFVISLYVTMIVRAIRIIGGLDDVYGKAIATGFVTLISFHVLVNVSMTMGFMPVVGLPLPAISYGGSSTLAFMIGAGFLLSVSRARKR